MPTELKVENIAHSDIDHAQETLVASLELALVEYLYSNYGGILYGAGKIRDDNDEFERITLPRRGRQSDAHMSKLSFQ